MSSTEDRPVWWPAVDAESSPSGVAVVSANYNTKRLIAQLLWSLHRFLGKELRSVVIVDNGSSDGSSEMLQAAADAGLCQLIANPQNRNHGPALSQGISHLAHMQRATASAPRPWVWLLDSDCVIARADAARHATAVAAGANAALMGEPYWNPWNRAHQFSGFSLLLDPARAWRAEIGAIPDGGDPIGEFEHACRAHDLPTHNFPFTAEGYLIHLGRSTLAGVYQRGEEAHPLYEWASGHHEPHFQDAPNAQARYATLRAEFEQQVPELSAGALIRACQPKA